MDSGSWIWNEYTNQTNTDHYNLCNDVTNHWLYFIFSGYLLPLISPRVRDWLKETLNSLKDSNVGGHIVLSLNLDSIKFKILKIMMK